MRQLIACILSILGLVFIWSLMALAADLPGTVQPGQIERQFQPEPEMRTEEPGPIVVPEVEPPGPPNAQGIRFKLTRLVIEGVTV